MSEKTSAEKADSQQHQPVRQEGESSSGNVTASDAGPDGGSLPAAGEVSAATAQLGSSSGAEPQLRSPRHADSGTSQTSADSAVAKAEAPSSTRNPSEAAVVVTEPSVPALEFKTKACQTPEQAKVNYRSLTLQFSPARHDQHLPSSNPALSLSSVTMEQDWPDAQYSPLSPMSPVSPPQRSDIFSVLWNKVAFTDAETASTNQPLTRERASDAHLPLRKAVPPGPTEDLDKEATPSTGLNKSAATQYLARQSDDADDKVFREPHDLGSPGSLVPWSETPRRLGVKRGTPEVIRDASSSLSVSVSATEISSPQIGTALNSPRLKLFAPSTTPRVPWTTLAVIWLQLQVHWNCLHKDHPERCASVSTIMIENRWERVLFAAFHHDDFHNLAVNSLCFFAKGVLLEAGLGTVHFAALFTIVATLVGLVNTLIVMFAHEYTRLPWLFTMCSSTFAGVVVALEVLKTTHFNRAKIHYGQQKFRLRNVLFGVLEVFVLLLCTKSNVCPIISGSLVGVFLANTSVGNFITRIQRPRRSLYLCVVPCAPITYMLAACVVMAFLHGPFADPLILAETGLSFPSPVWRPVILPLLYQPNVYSLAYTVLSLLDVGQELEQDVGHFGFMCLAGTLLLAVHGLLELLSGTIWRHLLALGESLPRPVSHFSLCTCGPVAFLMALKVIHHMRHPRCVYSMASMPIYVPFWTGMLFELAVLNASCTGSGAYVFGPIVGVLLGIAVAYAGTECVKAAITSMIRRSEGLSDVGMLLHRTEAPLGYIPIVLRS
ncbi:hypothetical protein HPB50_012486 [Hyalomma asiaticum]|uniref:Uncharacterized protein n=1 Tax=Hyalomma asiaticum TaxID=266040 RepID=A0ACB7SEU7_HYAAI|nr:hypothetical protein HPB50_012486 [Hyalomma asiaticum]